MVTEMKNKILIISIILFLSIISCILFIAYQKMFPNRSYLAEGSRWTSYDTSITYWVDSDGLLSGKMKLNEKEIFLEVGAVRNSLMFSTYDTGNDELDNILRHNGQLLFGAEIVSSSDNKIIIKIYTTNIQTFEVGKQITFIKSSE